MEKDLIHGIKKTNYHMHTVFCDGKADVSQMANAALDAGMTSFGFSGHALYPFSSDWHIAVHDYKNYVAAVNAVKQELKDKAQIYCGFEADFIPGVCTPSFSHYSEFKPEFLIGSVHYVLSEKEHGYFEADGNFVKAREQIKKYFGGNAKKAVQAYFASERQMLSDADFTFLGHCDLIRRQNSPKAPYKLFDEAENWYRRELKATAQKIAQAGVCVEINTGAVARGYLDEPYPSLEFLELLRQKNVPVTFASDAHATGHIDFAFEKAVALAKKAGYSELHYLNDGKLTAQRI